MNYVRSKHSHGPCSQIFSGCGLYEMQKTKFQTNIKQQIQLMFHIKQYVTLNFCCGGIFTGRTSPCNIKARTVSEAVAKRAWGLANRSCICAVFRIERDRVKEKSTHVQGSEIGRGQ